MIIRKATPSDASSIAAISIEVWVNTYLKKGVSAFFADFALKEFSVDNSLKLIRDPLQTILVSENAEGIDGLVRLSSNSTPPISGCSNMEIATLYVQPRHHGKGTGKSLLSAALKHCHDLDVDSVWLTTNAENHPAIAFYIAQGFEYAGETTFRIGDNGYLNHVYRISLR